MPRLAWFSPLPPVRSGIARYCSELLPGLAAEYDIDLFVDGPPAAFESPDERVQLFNAHDFIWKNRARPYDLIVYQLGNAPCHDYMWAYLVRLSGTGRSARWTTAPRARTHAAAATSAAAGGLSP